MYIFYERINCFLPLYLVKVGYTYTERIRKSKHHRSFHGLTVNTERSDIEVVKILGQLSKWKLYFGNTCADKRDFRRGISCFRYFHDLTQSFLSEEQANNYCSDKMGKHVAYSTFQHSISIKTLHNWFIKNKLMELSVPFQTMEVVARFGPKVYR